MRPTNFLWHNLSWRAECEVQLRFGFSNEKNLAFLADPARLLPVPFRGVFARGRVREKSKWGHPVARGTGQPPFRNDQLDRQQISSRGVQRVSRVSPRRSPQIDSSNRLRNSIHRQNRGGRPHVFVFRHGRRFQRA
jgi:hypothetical protein